MTGEEKEGDKYYLNDETAQVAQEIFENKVMEQGVDIDSISRRLGHADSRITREIYLHVTQKIKERDNERIKEVKLI